MGTCFVDPSGNHERFQQVASRLSCSREADPARPGLPLTVLPFDGTGPTTSTEAPASPESHWGRSVPHASGSGTTGQSSAFDGSRRGKAVRSSTSGDQVDARDRCQRPNIRHGLQHSPSVQAFSVASGSCVRGTSSDGKGKPWLQAPSSPSLLIDLNQCGCVTYLPERL